MVMNTQDYNYDHWYKITLTKRQAIRFYFEWLTLYSNSMTLVGPDRYTYSINSLDDENNYRTQVLEPGDYYLRLYASYYELGTAVRFSWK